MWWQPYNQGQSGYGANNDVWNIDNVYIGPNPAIEPPPPVIESTLSIGSGTLDPNSFVYATNGAIDQACISQSAFHFTGTSGTQILTTQDVTLGPGSFIQFDINIGCGNAGTLPAFDVVLEYSINSGQSWSSYVVPLCNSFQSTCGSSFYSWGESRYYLSDFNGLWRRVTIPLTLSGVTRFRWRNERGAGATSAAEWAVTNIHIGAGCPVGCGGRGRCINNTCVCDNGFALNSTGSCVVSSQIQTEFREQFESSLSAASWTLVEGGGNVQSNCGYLASGQSFQ